MSTTSHILFYSNRCQHSQQFIQLLKQVGIAEEITQVCIDHTPRHRIPGTVKSVPTLVIAGSLTPLVGDQAFLWLQEESRKKQEQRKQQAQQYAAMGGNTQSNPNTTNDNPEAWHSAEMDGCSYSDAYSFIGADTTAQGRGSSIPKSFAFLGTGGASGSSVPKLNVKNPFPEIKTTTPDYGQRQQGSNIEQFGQQPPTTAGLPSGYGSMPPNASMAPPSNTPGGDELSQRMEQMRVARDQDVQQPITRLT